MRRFLSAGFAFLSLLAALAAAYFFVQSFFQLSFLPLHLPSYGLLIRSYWGDIDISLFSIADWLPNLDNIPNWKFYFIGFGLASFTGSSGFTFFTLFLPHWFILALFLIHPILWIRRTHFWFNRGQQRRMSGQCPQCGYDLRGHLETLGGMSPVLTTPNPPPAAGKRCPECGTPIRPHIR